MQTDHENGKVMPNARSLRRIVWSLSLAVGALPAVFDGRPAAAAAGALAMIDRPIGVGQQATLAFADDFGGTGLDTTKWRTCYPWSRADGCTNASNEELQWYQPDAVQVHDGRLWITARRAVPALVRDGKRFDYTSGLITTANSFHMTYGYVEIRAQVPAGRGLWPAFWMLPVDQSWPPEIDIFEAIGHRPNEAIVTYHGAAADAPQAVVPIEGLSKGMHTFAVDWRADAITWWIDNNEVFRVEAPVPAKPMYVLVNLAVGGTFPGDPDESTVFPASLVVDYIRAWT